MHLIEKKWPKRTQNYTFVIDADTSSIFPTLIRMMRVTNNTNHAQTAIPKTSNQRTK